MKCDEMYVGKLTKDVVIRLVSVCPLRNNSGLVIWWRILVVLVVLVQQWWGRKLWTNGVFVKRFKVKNEFRSIRWLAPLNIKGTAPNNKPVPLIFNGENYGCGGYSGDGGDEGSRLKKSGDVKEWGRAEQSRPTPDSDRHRPTQTNLYSGRDSVWVFQLVGTRVGSGVGITRENTKNTIQTCGKLEGGLNRFTSFSNLFPKSFVAYKNFDSMLREFKCQHIQASLI